jgi:hypothetical protein
MRTYRVKGTFFRLFANDEKSIDDVEVEYDMYPSVVFWDRTIANECCKLVCDPCSPGIYRRGFPIAQHFSTLQTQRGTEDTVLFYILWIPALSMTVSIDSTVFVRVNLSNCPLPLTPVNCRISGNPRDGEVCTSVWICFACNMYSRPRTKK